METPSHRLPLIAFLVDLLHREKDLVLFWQGFVAKLRQHLEFDRLIWGSFTPLEKLLAFDFHQGKLRVETLETGLLEPAVSWCQHHPAIQVASSVRETLPFTLDAWCLAQGYALRIYCPLQGGGQAVGIWCLLCRDGQGPDQEVLNFLGTLNQLLAMAMERALLETQVQQSRGRLQREAHYLRDELKNERDLRPLTGESQAMKNVRRAIQQVAQTDSTVLIIGETGTGKELVARAIHQLSTRRDHLLVKVNCAALGANVITSELFGHEQGAFTGALKRRIGRFELAQQGTIFLDEIGEIPPEVQVLLLRVLQERIIERVGSNEPLPIDVRIIAATNQNLEKAVQDGRFRADLFYRLNVFPLSLPPLRERREDIPSLVSHFLQFFNRRMNQHVGQVHPHALELLTRYHWPGNVRELENVMERAMIVSTGDVLQIDPTWLPVAPLAAREPSPSSLANLERQTILQTLANCQGRIYGPQGAAAALGLKPSTLYGKMRKHHIPRQPSSDSSTTIPG